MTFNNTLYLTPYTNNSIYPAVHFRKLHKEIHPFYTNSSNSRIFVIYNLVWGRYKPSMHSHCFQDQECLSLHVRVMADTSPPRPPGGWDRASTTQNSLEIRRVEMQRWQVGNTGREITTALVTICREKRDVFIYYCRRLKCRLCARFVWQRSQSKRIMAWVEAGGRCGKHANSNSYCKCLLYLV